MRRVIGLLAGGLMVGALAVPSKTLGDQSARPAREFFILRCEERTASTVRLGVIALDSRAAADATLRELDAGSPFDALAQERSTHPTAVDGGRFGVFAPTDLRPEFAMALEGVPVGGHTHVIDVSAPEASSGWPLHIPVPGTPLGAIEMALGRAHSVAIVSPGITELTYVFGLRLGVHERRGLGLVEFGGPWSRPVFGIQIDEPMPQTELDAFSRSPRFTRGVYVGLPAHPHWFVDVDDRADSVRRLLFVDPSIYGNSTGIPGVP